MAYGGLGYDRLGFDRLGSGAGGGGAPPLPGAPVIAATADSHEQITITIVAGSGATGHAILRSTTSPVALDPGNVIDDTLGPSPTEFIDSGLDPETEYFYVVVAVNDNGITPSNEDSATTDAAPPAELDATSAALIVAEQPSDVAFTSLALIVAEHEILPVDFTAVALIASEYEPQPPTIVKIAETSTSVTFQNLDHDPAAAEVEYQVAESADTGYAAALQVLDNNPLTFQFATFSGLTPGQGYRAKARMRFGALWTDYGPEVTWTQTAPASDDVEFLAPLVAAFVRGASVSVTWSALPAGVTADLLEISDDGTTWTTLASNLGTGTSYVLDSTALANEWYQLRLTFSDGSSIEHVGFYPANGLADTAERSGFYSDGISGVHPFGAYTHVFGPSVGWWIYPAGDPNNELLGTESTHPVSMLTPTDEQWFRDLDGLTATARAMIMTSGAGFQWERMYDAEDKGVGLAVFGRSLSPNGLPVAVFIMAHTKTMSPALTPPTGCTDSAAVEAVCGSAGVSTGRVILAAGELTNLGGGPTAGATYLSVRDPVALRASWDGVKIGGCSRICDPRLAWYGIMLNVTRPDPVNFPNRIHVRATMAGQRFDETIDVVDINGDPLIMDCGSVGPITWGGRIAGGTDFGRQVVGAINVAALSSTCTSSTPPIPLLGELAVDILCDDVTLTGFPPEAVTAVRWIINGVTDPSFSYDSGFIPPEFTPDPGGGIPAGAPPVHLVEDLPAGDYEAIAQFVLVSSGIIETDPVPFTIDVNTAPTEPVWLQPSDQSVFFDVTQFTAEFGPATDAEMDPLEYEVRATSDGATYKVIRELGTVLPNTPFTIFIDELPNGLVTLEVRAFDGCLYGPPDTICIEVRSKCPLVAVNPSTVRRIEIRTDFLGNGGRLLGFVPEWTSCIDHRERAGEKTCAIELPRLSRDNEAQAVFGKLEPGRVVRTVWEDFTWDEWRVVFEQDVRDGLNGVTTRLECEAPIYDLNRARISRTEADGFVELSVPRYGMTAEELLQDLMRSAPGMFSPGYVSSVVAGRRFDVDYMWDSVRAGLEKIAEVTGLEIDEGRACRGIIMVSLSENASAANQPPTASAIVTQTASDPNTWNFDGSGSSDPNDAVMRWDWTIDGQAYEGETVDVTFPGSGSYAWELVVTDHFGVQSTPVSGQVVF